MDVIEQFNLYKISFPRNYSRLVLVSFFLNSLAKKKILATEDVFNKFVEIVVPKQELESYSSEISKKRELHYLYEAYKQQYMMETGLYRPKGGRPYKYDYTITTIIYPDRDHGHDGNGVPRNQEAVH
jgi:hypothetical protein